MRKRGRSPGSSRKKSAAALLDRFSLDDVRLWSARFQALAAFHRDLDESLRYQRTRFADQLRQALLAAARGPSTFEAQRVVDYRYSHDPLSTVGSVLTSPGGRFNIGDIEPLRFPRFAALYAAIDKETALVEHLGEVDQEATNAGLTLLDLALRRPESIAVVAIRGSVESSIDLRERDRLNAFVRVLARFEIPKSLANRAKRLDQHASIIGTVPALLAALLHREWRGWPQGFGVPSVSQVFGQLVCDAGVEAIIYPSAKTDRTCWAVFPSVLSGTSSVEIAGAAPPGVSKVRMDAGNWKEFV